MDSVVLLLLFLNAHELFGLKCYTCNSKQHPGVCDYRGNLTEQHSKHIVDCKGSCKVGTMRNNIDEVHIRMCQKNLNNGCDKRAVGFICQCSTDFCNKDLMTCHKESQCTQSLSTKPQNHQLQTSNVNLMASKEAEFHGINRSITIFGTVIGCLVGLVLLVLVIVIVFKTRKDRQRGRIFHPLKVTFRSVNTNPTHQDPPPTYQDVIKGKNVRPAKNRS